MIIALVDSDAHEADFTVEGHEKEVHHELVPKSGEQFAARQRQRGTHSLCTTSHVLTLADFPVSACR